MFSNRNLAVIALALMIGVVGDGLLYNRAPLISAIYPLDDPRSIEIRYREELLLALHKAEDQSWQITAPFQAPANASRVALLLDSNVQTTRSYTTQDIVAKDLVAKKNKNTIEHTLPPGFADPVELQINNQTFLIGDIEPVSQLRFVSAKDRIYLQADHIIPLLQSARSTFTDLLVTGKVKTVELDYQTPESDSGSTQTEPQANTKPISADQLSHWSNLKALAVMDADALDETTIAVATLSLEEGDKQFEITPLQSHLTLRPVDAKFAYVLSEQQASKLGVCLTC